MVVEVDAYAMNCVAFEHWFESAKVKNVRII